MPGKRNNSSRKNVDDEDEKESQEVAHETKATKKTEPKGWMGGEKSQKATEGSDKKPKEGVPLSRKLTRDRALIENVLDDYKAPEQVIVLGDGKIPSDEILLASWNVASMNGVLRNQGAANYINDRKPDILCLNETKLTDENYEEVGKQWIPEGYYSYFNNCKVRKGYSGTAIITKFKPISVTFDLGVKKHDLEGRTITAEYEHFYIVSCYVPNAGDSLEGLAYRAEEWDPDFRKYLTELKKKKHVIVCGDLNCAHKEIDIHNPKGHEGDACFTAEERRNFGELLASGFVDTFRYFNPDEQKFSYFSKRQNNRGTNKGWRLDYFLISKEGLVGAKDSLINDEVFGSDHLPVELILNPQFT